MTSRVELQAFVIADHIYCDQGSNKYVIAGTFHQLNLSAFPAVHHKTVGVYIAVTNLDGAAPIEIVFEDRMTGEVLLRTRPLELVGRDPALPVELALEVPPLPLPHPGRYAFHLFVGGERLGTAPIVVTLLELRAPEPHAR